MKYIIFATNAREAGLGAASQVVLQPVPGDCLDPQNFAARPLFMRRHCTKIFEKSNTNVYIYILIYTYIIIYIYIYYYIYMSYICHSFAKYVLHDVE